VGILLLYVLNAILPNDLIVTLAKGKFSLDDIITSMLNGALVAVLALLFHLHRNQRLKQSQAKSRFPSSGRTIFYALVVAFICGVLDVLLVLHAWGIMTLTTLILVILIWHLRLFSGRVVVMLKPGNVATWGDVSDMLRTYITMLAGFTMVNATLEGIHIMTKQPVPFGFADGGGDIFINSLYFTVVTMTTLGFGDITPQTVDGKLLLIFECMVSYVMFALMVGIITRGVVRARDLEE